MSRRSLAVVALINLFIPAMPAAAESTTIAIGAVQGTAIRSPLEGKTVAIQGVVTADLRAGLGGVFVQDAGDGDARSSDALFVQGMDDAALAVGDRVEVVGTVAETDAGGAATLTTLRAQQWARRATRQPLPVRQLQAAPADWEALEGEHLRIAVPLTVAGSDRLGRYGELLSAFDGRLWQPSEIAVPGTAAHARVAADNARRRLLLDDGSSQRNPAKVAYLDAGAEVRSGMQLHDVEGIVDQRYDGGYRLHLSRPLALPKPMRAPAPKLDADLHIAAFNLENLFNGDGRGGGFPTKRGARTPAEYQAQLRKLVTTINALQADVAALMELENDGYGADSSIAQLVAALNATPGKPADWRFVHAGKGPGTHPIRVGLIYRAARLTPVGPPVVLEGGPFAEHSRAPLAQAFRAGQGPAFVVVANHFKSKGCTQASGDDADRGDGQGCWNATRTESARQLHQWLQTDPAGTGSDLAVLLGDFNAYAMEAPLRELHAEGWRDAFTVAGVERPYSFVYDGQSGRLDHALLSPAMARHLRGAAEWHINADEQDEQGYRQRNLPGPWRSADHDPLLLGFSF